MAQPGRSTTRAPGPVPVRTIAAAIGMVIVAAIVLVLLYQLRQVVLWLAVGVFLAAALYPVVNWVQLRIFRNRRAPATLLVFLLVAVVVVGLLTLFAIPLAQEGVLFAQQLPQLITDARSGRGPVGHLLDRTHALQWVQRNQSRIASFATGLTTPAASILRSVAIGILGVITVYVFALLLALEGPKIVRVGLSMIDNGVTRERVRKLSAEASKSITGYVTGNVLISIICGLLTFLVLKVMNVPFAGLLALFVAVTDLLPIIGAAIGGVVAVIVAGVQSVPALIVVAIFIVAYQQVENHVLQPVILSKTVKLNPLTVVIAIVAGFELRGILGALLAIPLAGIIQVVARDLWGHRRARQASVDAAADLDPAAPDPGDPNPAAAGPAAPDGSASASGSAGPAHTSPGYPGTDATGGPR